MDTSAPRPEETSQPATGGLCSFSDLAVSLNDDETAVRALEKAPPPPEILVVSDLHLGEGLDRVTGRWAFAENFFADKAFLRFLAFHHSAASEGALLVLNGDVFDFLRIVDTPRKKEDFEDWSRTLSELGVSKSIGELEASIHKRVEWQYGLRTTNLKSVWKFIAIARGHPEFFDALANWLKAGGRLLAVKGNHDLELHWELVRKSFRVELRKRGASRAAVTKRVFFSERSFQCANLYFEHGHPYEDLTRVEGKATLSQTPEELNYPLGSFVNRYLINRLEGLRPFVANIKPVHRALLPLLSGHPLKCFRALLPGARFIGRAITMSGVWRGKWTLIFIACVFVQSLAALLLLGVFVASLISHFYPEHFVKVITPILKMKCWSLLGLLPWFLGFFRDAFPRRKPNVGEDSVAESLHKALASFPSHQADRISYAVLGHTHHADVQCLKAVVPNGPSILYLNTGTWAPLWPEDRPDLLGRIYYPFVRFTLQPSGSYKHEYLCWNDDRGEPVDYLLRRSASCHG